LRGPDVEKNVSSYSALPNVRASMVRRQRAIANRGAAILAGRDIGTVVLPKAPLKLYLDASEDARAKRRGTQTTQDAKDARQDISNRDRVDAARTVSPMKPATDAIVVDTTEMTLDEVIALALEKVACAKS
jgi:cytidylate kinase